MRFIEIHESVPTRTVSIVANTKDNTVVSATSSSDDPEAYRAAIRGVLERVQVHEAYYSGQYGAEYEARPEDTVAAHTRALDSARARGDTAPAPLRGVRAGNPASRGAGVLPPAEHGRRTTLRLTYPLLADREWPWMSLQDAQRRRHSGQELLAEIEIPDPAGMRMLSVHDLEGSEDSVLHETACGVGDIVSGDNRGRAVDGPLLPGERLSEHVALGDEARGVGVSGQSGQRALRVGFHVPNLRARGRRVNSESK